MKRTVELTEEQVTVMRASLECWERAVRDTSYDPQLQEWARTHSGDPERTAAAIRDALAKGSPTS